MREVIKEPNILLHQQCEPVTKFKEAKKIADELLNLMISVPIKFGFYNRWLGFAANQIGYSKRIIAIRNRDRYEVMVNPEFIKKKFPFPYLESCFSLKKKGYYLVKRYLWAKVKYQNLEGQPQEIILRGPNAIYQEIDHLNGIMVSEIGFRIL